MMTRVKTAAISGVEGYVVVVEIDINRGLPGIHIVGLADTMIKEAYQRIRPAIRNSGFKFPGERVTINLVPASKQKEGSHFDLPMAVGIIMTMVDISSIEDTAFLGEVSLDGKLNPVKGVLPMIASLRREGVKKVILPVANADEAAIFEDMEIMPAESLPQVIDHVLEDRLLDIYKKKKTSDSISTTLDFSQVYGQENVKRAIVIGISGNHGILMMGGPGCGKTMMAKRIPTILPKLSFDDKLEITSIYSVAGLLSDNGTVIEERPFRAPHHRITIPALVGGGSKPKPGELSLAHKGVLFLDELGEFDLKTIDALRQPIEDGKVRINRISEEYIFPSEVTLVIASNPCKCGHLWDDKETCTCTRTQINSYKKKLMGPFADRIDMHLKINPVSWEYLEEYESKSSWMSSAQMRELVENARNIQRHRYEDTRYSLNGDLDEAGIEKFCILDERCQKLLNMAYRKLGLSMRARGKIIKLSRTIADVEGCSNIKPDHLAEALMYRGLE